MADKLSRRPDITEAKDLSQAEKEALVLVWQKLVLGQEGETVDLSTKSLEETRKWLQQSLMAEIKKLTTEWDVKQGLDILKDSSLGSLADRQLLFIEYIKDQFSIRTKKFAPATEKSSKFDSWPAMMQQNKQFNCVGGSLLGASFLEQAGIKFWQGSAVGHAINIAQLDDGRWLYVDFLNGLVKEITPKIKEVRGQTMLEVDDGEVWYKNIHLLSADAVGVYVLGNLSALINEAQEEMGTATKEEEVDYFAAKEYFQANKDLLMKTSLHDLRAKLYPEVVKIGELDEIETERHIKEATKKMDILISRDYNRLIKREGSDEKLTEEVQKRISDILNWLNNFEGEFPQGVSELLGGFLKIVQDGLREIKKEQPETVFAEVLDNMAKRFSRIKSRR
ncbi:MAG: hypothetical protein NTU97_01950 [Candidatus Magasanikbacteria bacterium]|nr:hypothetical protein [Candidatus Magasanikbacteria bacterium]